MLAELLLDDRELVVLTRIAERGPQEEAVELGFRERERALLLDRVLGREHEERVRELSRDPVDRHLLLRHRLEERGLRLRHGAVDLVDEEDVREHRAGPELEVAVALVEDGQPGHVRRLEVRRALDALVRRALDRPGDRAREHRLRRARDVLEEDVPPAQERRDDELDPVRLALDHRLDVGDVARRGLLRVVERSSVGRAHPATSSSSLPVLRVGAAPISITCVSVALASTGMSTVAALSARPDARLRGACPWDRELRRGAQNPETPVRAGLGQDDGLDRPPAASTRR